MIFIRSQTAIWLWAPEDIEKMLTLLISNQNLMTFSLMSFID